MAFTRPWDNTFPPDTQQANLLGQDIRRDKEDTAERLRAFGAGLIGSRETPEADFGNANIGAIFWAENEGKLYRWNGSAWNVVSMNRIISNSTRVTLTNPAAATDGINITIPANLLIVGAVIDIDASIRYVSDSDAISAFYRLFFGATQIAAGAVDGFKPGDVHLHASVLVTGASAQKSIGSAVSGQAISTPSAAALRGGPGEAISGAIVVKTRTEAAPNEVQDHDMIIARITFG